MSLCIDLRQAAALPVALDSPKKDQRREGQSRCDISRSRCDISRVKV